MKKFFKTHMNTQTVLLILILLVAVVLRFYNFPLRYSLGEETVRDAVIGIEGARQIQFPLTGAFSSLGPFTFGPWYQYQLIVASMVFPTVYAPWIYLTLISILYVFILYKIGKVLDGTYFGLALAFLAAISPVGVISATHLTSHNNTHLFAALSVWIFLLLLLRKRKSYWWGFLLGFVIGVGMNLHFQMGGLLILPLLLMLYKCRNFYKHFIGAAIGVVTSFLPLLFFELNNHWFTTRNILYYLQEGKNAVYVPNRWLTYVGDFWPSYWADVLGIPVWAGAIGIIALFGALGFLVFKKKKLPLAIVLLLIAFGVNFLLLRFYWGPRFFGYLNFLRPFVFIFTVFTIFTIAKYTFRKYVVIALIAALTLLAWPRLLFDLAPDSFTKAIHDDFRKIESLYPNDDFSLYTCAKEYSPSFNAISFGLLFAAEAENKYSYSGKKLGIANDCDGVSIESGKIVSTVLGAPVVDLSIASDSALAKTWNPLSFKGIYDSYARWWFKAQP